MNERRTFAELRAGYRRAILLRFLSEDADYAMDTGLLTAALKSVGRGLAGGTRACGLRES